MAMPGIFDRVSLLLGRDALEALASKRVIVFGVGGVGSWCAECLVRTGVGHLTIVDFDRVSVTNVNRQLMATSKNVGEVKVNVLRERLLEINPDADITAVEGAYTDENREEFHLQDYDCVIDCIDSLKDKISLLVYATTMPARVYSSMGAALKLDPTKIQVAEFWKVHGCPLGSALRSRIRHQHLSLSQRVMCVFSDEVLPNLGAEENDETCTYKARINGSLAHITAIFGFTLAGLVIKDMVLAGDRAL